MTATITRIGPSAHGKRMSLKEFNHAEVEQGYHYELSRGIVTVSDVPGRGHLLQVAAIRDQFQSYKFLNPRRIHVIASGSECKLLIGEFESERHPDLAIYLKAPPEIDDDELWLRWLPEIVIEVVSASSRERDFHQKPDEYLRLGVKEYWIVDADSRAMIVMRRSRGKWVESTVNPPVVYRTRLLPGFEFSVGDVLKTAGLD
jgi:Uma2 family endonuclease